MPAWVKELDGVDVYKRQGDILDIIETDDFRQFFRVIHHIQLRASYQGCLLYTSRCV